MISDNRSLPPAHVITIGTGNAVFVDGTALGTRLTRKEEDFLRAVMSHSHVATKEYLLTAVYGGMDEPGLKIVDVFMSHLRTKLGEHRDAIETVWGRGYSRSPAYAMTPAAEFGVAVGVNAKLAEDISFAAGEPLAEIVDRLLRAEYARLWDAL